MTWYYFGTKRECGCTVAAAIDMVAEERFGGDTPDNKRMMAETLAEYVENGYIIEHKELDGPVGYMLKGCPHKTEQLELL